jgi:hydroxymethylbilane synthase
VIDMRPLRLGTRASALALTQSGLVADALRALGVPVDLVTIRTLGDQRPPDTTWGEGAFVGALEAALLAGDVDLAVHSAKDVPTSEDPRLVIAAYPPREDPRDALVGRGAGLTLDDLPTGSRIGTDSPRRTAFLRVRRPDLTVHPLHGNVDTRLRRLDDGETDGLILAVAGLTRLGLEGRIGQIIPAEVVPPAPGQGALAIQCRAEDAHTLAWLARLDDPATRWAVETERAFLHASGGGCRAPIGGLARVADGAVVLVAGSAGIEEPDAADRRPVVAWGEVRGRVADRVPLAAGLAARLNDQLASARPATTRAGAARVLVMRTAAQAGPLSEALRAGGLEVLTIPTIEVEPSPAGGPLDAALGDLGRYAWVVVTSPNGAVSILDAIARVGADPAATRWAAVGRATAAVLEERGVTIEFLPADADGAGIARDLPARPGDRVLIARADIADGVLPERLRARGVRVDEVVAYRTVEGPQASREPLAAAFAAGPFDALVFTSGSTIRGLLALLTPQDRRIALRSIAWCIGPSTATVAREHGFGRVRAAATRSAEALATEISAELATPLLAEVTP